MGVLEKILAELEALLAAGGAAIDDFFLTIGDKVVNYLSLMFRNAGMITCDLICTGIVIYTVVCAFKIITCPAHQKPKFSLIEHGTYLTVAYFISRLMSLVIPCL